MTRRRRGSRLVRNDQQKLGQFYQELQPLIQRAQRGLFGEGSLFAKSVRATLDRRAGRPATTRPPASATASTIGPRSTWRSACSAATTLGLTDDQRPPLFVAGVLLAETAARHPRVGQQITYYLVMFKASQIDAGQAPGRSSTTAQWRVINNQIVPGQGDGGVPEGPGGPRPPSPQRRAPAMRRVRTSGGGHDRPQSKF